MRRASPSTIAVLPTPGSPMSTGLFFVRRDSTWMTRRISSSRPMTGSSLPLRAASVRSRPYFSSAWYCSSGLSLVTRCSRAPACSASSTASCVTPSAAQEVADAAGHLGHREQHVLGREVVVVELPRARCRRPRAGGTPRARAARRCAVCAVDLRAGRPRASSTAVAHRLRGRRRSARARRQHDALGLAEQRREQVLGRDLRWLPARARSDWAAPRASRVLRVNRLGSSGIARTS